MEQSGRAEDGPLLGAGHEGTPSFTHPFVPSVAAGITSSQICGLKRGRRRDIWTEKLTHPRYTVGRRPGRRIRLLPPGRGPLPTAESGAHGDGHDLDAVVLRH